jgi:hypothetical protein
MDQSRVCGDFIVVSSNEDIALNKISRLDEAEDIASKKCMDENAPARVYRLELVCTVTPRMMSVLQPVKNYPCKG